MAPNQMSYDFGRGDMKQGDKKNNLYRFNDDIMMNSDFHTSMKGDSYFPNMPMPTAQARFPTPGAPNAQWGAPKAQPRNLPPLPNCP